MRAHARNHQVLVHSECFPAECVQIEAQCAGHDLQKLAGTGGTTVVHFELLHLAVGEQCNGLAVLTADIQHGAGFGKEKACPFGMGLDLGHGRRFKGHLEQVAPVAGGHDPFIEQICEQSPGLRHGIKTGVGLAAENDLPSLVHQHYLYGT